VRAFSRWDWAITLAFLIGNGLWLRSRAERFGLEHPELEPGFRKIVRAFFVYFGTACLLWGFGVLTGLGGHLISRRSPPTGYETACLVLGLAVAVRSAVWVYSQGGAAFLARHAMLFRHWPSSVAGNKIAWGIILAAVMGGIGASFLGAVRP
jgi:hypothetical protein